MSDKPMTVEEALRRMIRCVPTPDDDSIIHAAVLLQDAFAAIEREKREAAQKAIDESMLGLCPHGNLKCFYCWRDAGFPGEISR